MAAALSARQTVGTDEVVAIPGSAAVLAASMVGRRLAGRWSPRPIERLPKPGSGMDWR